MEQLPEELDVLIVGCGPAGLTLATQLARFPDIRTSLVEKNAGKLEKGHADGLQVRSLEMFKALGFVEKVVKDAYQVNEMTFWEPDGDGGIYRASRSKDTEEGISEQPHVILSQAHLHEHFLQRMLESENPIKPLYGYHFEGIEQLPSSSGGFSEVVIRRSTSEDTSRQAVVKAKYIVGCDGAQSTVRDCLGVQVDGDASNSVWGVMDAMAETNFPDIRVKVGIRSSANGSILIIPKADRDHFVARIYVEMDQTTTESLESHSDITWQSIAEKAQKIFRPYTFEVKEVIWWSKYVIGQRLCRKFDNGTERRPPNIFIAGDACHTHSPKAGQGMNVSMADAFNLGWKLASVVRGAAHPDILRTYTVERQTVAKELIDFDEELTKVFSSHTPQDPEEAEANKDRLRDIHLRKAAFSAGVGVKYQHSRITSGSISEQNLAGKFVIGKRFHSARVLRCADACPVHLGHALSADCRWRLIIFAGADQPADKTSRTWKLCTWLSQSIRSPVRKYTPSGADVDSVIEVIVVYRQSHASFDLSQVPSLLWPRKKKYHGVRDYRKVFTDHWDKGEYMESIYDSRGIDKQQGCMVIVRPDQYVSAVFDLSDLQGLEKFFGGFMLEHDQASREKPRL